MSGVRIERVVTSGVIAREMGGFQLENNVWLVGDDEEVIVIDAAHNAAAIERAVGDRNPLGVLLTHGHEDHVNAAVELAARIDSHLYLHPDDLFLWQRIHETMPDFELAPGAKFTVGGVELTTLHTPGHTPGSVCFAVPALNTVFSGDTLFKGGPGATRWEYSSFPQIIESIQSELFVLPDDMRANPGHGDNTTIAAETVQLQAYIERGW